MRIRSLAQAAIALTLHALAYPDCDANVALYVTVVDRLVSQGDTAVADLLGQDGLLLQDRPEAGLLQERLVAIQGPSGNAGDMAVARRFRTEMAAGGSSGPAAAWGGRP